MKLYQRLKERRGFTLMEIVLVLGIFSTSLLLVMNIFATSTNLQRRSIISQRLSGDARFTMETIARTVRSGTVDYDFYEGRTPYFSDDQAYNLSDPTYPLHVLAVNDQDGNRTIIRRKSLDPVNDKWGKLVQNGRLKVDDQIEICLETSICVKPDYSGNKNECNSDADCDEAGGESCKLSCEFWQSWSDITPESVRLTGGSQHLDEPYGLKFFIIPDVNPYWLIDPINGIYAADQQPIVRMNLVTRGTGASEDERKINYVQTSVGSRYYER